MAVLDFNIDLKTINGASLIGTGNITIQGCSFGTDGQIPFMNGDGDDFSYSSGLTYTEDSEIYASGNVKFKLQGQSGWDFTITSVGSNTHQIGGGNTLNIAHGNLNHSGTSHWAYGSANKQFSIGSSSDLGARLGVKGSGSTSATTNFLLQNSSGTDLFKVLDDGKIGVGTTSPSTTLHVSGGVSGAIGTRVAQLEGNLPELLLMDTSDSKGFSFSKYGNNLYFVNTNSSGAYSSYAGLIQLNSGKWSIGHGNNPSAQLHVKSGGSTSASTNFLLQNSSGTSLFKVTDDGQVNISSLPTSSAGLSSGDIWNDSGTLKIV